MNEHEATRGVAMGIIWGIVVVAMTGLIGGIIGIALAVAA